MDGLTPADLLAFAKAGMRKQAAYERARKKWAREIKNPIRGHETEPDPAVYDGADPEEG